MFSTNRLEHQIYMIAIETEPDAILTTGKDMATLLVKANEIPMIVVKHDRKPPHDTGDYIIVPKSIEHKCKRIMGELVAELDEFASIYELVKAEPMLEYRST